MRRALLAGLCLFFAAAFAALGAWQVERRAWKLDLIARVDTRVHAAPQPLPATSSGLNARDDEYRRVIGRGLFLNDRETLVQAVTEDGPGWWVMTPLQTPQGTILVNRGFVSPDRADPTSRRAGSPAGAVTVTGLLRMSEPGGAFLRANDPPANRWYSRDVAAIAAARRLGPVAPVFIDADATPNPGGFPKGGMTVVSFRNAHLAYAITWFALSLLALVGLWLVVRSRSPE